MFELSKSKRNKVFYLVNWKKLALSQYLVPPQLNFVLGLLKYRRGL